VAYSPVYSVPLILYAAATPNESFEVPSGFTVVVRDIELYTGVGDSLLTVALWAPGAPAYINFAALNAVGINSSAQWRGHVALPEGYTVGLDISEIGAGDTAYVGGYLLRNILT